MNMKLRYLAASAVLCVAGAASTAWADEPLTADVGVDLLSDYVFRGQNLYDGVSIQPAASVGYSLGELGTIGGSFWSHLSAEDDSPPEKFTEIDWTIDYEITIDVVTFGAGLIWYTYPRGDDQIANTEEFYVSASLDTFLAPSLTYYRDYDEYDINYFELGFEHGIEGAGWNLTPSLIFGFADNADKIYKDDGLEFIAAGVSSEFTAGEISVTPSVTFIIEVDDTTDDELVLGISLGYGI